MPAQERQQQCAYIVTGSSEGGPPRLYRVTEDTSGFKKKTKTASSVHDEPHQCNTNQLRINFCIAKILAVALFIVGVVGLILVFFNGDGVHLFSVDFADISDGERKKLLDMYNSRFSNFMSGINKAIEIAIQPLVAVGILCLGAKWFTSKSELNLLVGMAPTLVGAVIAFLVCNGPTSVNVQLVPGETRLRMLTEDIYGVHVTATDEYSAWDASLNEGADNNSVLNTILRTRYIPVEEASSSCKRWSDSLFEQFGLEIELPPVMFGYPESSWQLDALPSAIEPKESLNLFVRGSRGDSYGGRATNFDPRALRTLYIMSLLELYEDLGALWGLHPHMRGDDGAFYNFVSRGREAAIAEWNTPNGTDSNDDELVMGELMSFAGDNFLPAAAVMLHTLLGNASSIAADEAEAIYNLHSLADSLTYTSLTLKIPTRKVDVPEENETLTITERCGSDGCITNESLFGATNDIHPFVKATPLCEGLDSDDNNFGCRLLLSSMGKRINGDEFNLSLSSQTPGIVTTGLHTTFSLTVGILNWSSENLAAFLGAECADIKTNCSGVRLSTKSLQQNGKVLLVGDTIDTVDDIFDASAILGAYVKWIPCDWLVWQKLVQVGSALPMLLPRNFVHVDEAARDYFHGSMNGSCSIQADKFLKNTMRNHLFAEDSLQMSYTARLHFVFKNGVLHAIDGSDLAGNVHQFKLQVSIPSTNCLLSIVGCCVLVVLSLSVAAAHTHGKSIIEGNSSAPVLAEAMTNTDKFPRSLLKLSVEQRDAEGTQARLVELDQVEMAAAEFVEKKQPS